MRKIQQYVSQIYGKNQKNNGRIKFNIDTPLKLMQKKIGTPQEIPTYIFPDETLRKPQAEASGERTALVSGLSFIRIHVRTTDFRVQFQHHEVIDETNAATQTEIEAVQAWIVSSISVVFYRAKAIFLFVQIRRLGIFTRNTIAEIWATQDLHTCLARESDVESELQWSLNRHCRHIIVPHIRIIGGISKFLAFERQRRTEGCPCVEQWDISTDTCTEQRHVLRRFLADGTIRHTSIDDEMVPVKRRELLVRTNLSTCSERT